MRRLCIYSICICFSLLFHSYPITNISMRKIYSSILFVCLNLYAGISAANFAPIVFDINHNKIDFETLKGKWILVNFWASWCEPCVNEIHEFNKLSEKYKDTIRIFAVNYDSLNPTEQKNIANKYEIKYPTLLQSSTKNLNLGHIPVIPITYIYNQQGKLVSKLYGGQTVASIEETIKELDSHF